MATTSVIAQMVDTILSVPGMGEMVKIDLKISRKNAFLLNNVIERGLNSRDDEKGDGLLAHIPKETLEELRSISVECLEKAGLVELSEKLKNLGKG